MAAVRQMPNSISSEQKMERFLTELATKHDVAASTQNQAFNAILFFYRDVLGIKLNDIDSLRAVRPAHVRTCPSRQDTLRLLDAIKDIGGYPTNLATRLLYGCGLRVSEAVSLRVKDLKLDRSELFIMGAKGGKDRVVKLPCSLTSALTQQVDFARHVWRKDALNKLPIQLPHQLAKKYPEMEFNFGWAWLFPLRYPCADPRTGRMVRWHMLTDSIQRAVKEARRRTGIMAVPHELRHAYATHSLDRGVNMKALSEAMGHKQIETTAGYCHATALSVPSPLDTQ
jgi:site-specific recombinase XerD